MPTRFKTVAVAAALCAGMSSAAMAQTYAYCPAGYVLVAGVCQPAATPGGVVGGAVGAAGSIVGGAVGAAGSIAGGALNAAGNIVGGTVGAVTGAPPPPPVAPGYGSSTPPGPVAVCAPGYVLYRGACYPQ